MRNFLTSCFNFLALLGRGFLRNIASTKRGLFVVSEIVRSIFLVLKLEEGNLEGGDF